MGGTIACIALIMPMLNPNIVTSVSLEHLVVLELGNPLGAVAIVLASKVGLDTPDTLSDLGQALLQLHAQVTGDWTFGSVPPGC